MPFKANAARRHHIPKQRRRVTNWAEYDAALRQRGSLTVWFTEAAVAAWEAEPRTTPGGQPPLYGAFDVKLLFQALPRCRAPSFSRVLVSSCPEIGTDRPHTSGSMGSGLATAHRDDRREARPRARIVAPQPCMRPIPVGSEP
jgi:hypothetical protein